jgi:uncharacterized protein
VLEPATRHTGVLLDTGPLVAILHRKDTHHQICLASLQQIRPPLMTCWPVITEAAWLLRHYSRALSQLSRGVEEGLFSILPLEEDSLAAIAKKWTRYADLNPQLADLALLHLAEVHELTTVFTLDRRDFAVMRDRQRRRLLLLPEDLG